jgi:hypothetical protein
MNTFLFYSSLLWETQLVLEFDILQDMDWEKQGGIRHNEAAQQKLKRGKEHTVSNDMKESSILGSHVSLDLMRMTRWNQMVEILDTRQQTPVKRWGATRPLFCQGVIEKKRAMWEKWVCQKYLKEMVTRCQECNTQPRRTIFKAISKKQKMMVPHFF